MTTACETMARRGDGLPVDQEKDAEEGIYKYKLVLAYDGSAYAGWQLQVIRHRTQRSLHALNAAVSIPIPWLNVNDGQARYQ